MLPSLPVNPVIPMDFPDPDIIRVGDTYYMVSTTMYFMPGCVILRSYDLIHWEYHARVYDQLEDTPAQHLAGGENAYGKGMWAASLRYHQGMFHITFAAYDTGKTYLFRSPSADGPWRRSEIRGFYHDSSLFFDADGRAYIIYGAGQIHITELDHTLSGPAEGGLDRVIADSGPSDFLGYEGSHFYRIGGRYYLFVIHSRRDRWRRVESCLSADSLAGTFTGGVIWDDDLSFFDQGVAQGGIVDTPDGRWFSFLFQDRGACGRMPVLLPMHWRDGMPVIEPDLPCIQSTRPDHVYQPLFGSDDFSSPQLKPYWEWNHIPDRDSCTWGKGAYRITNHTCASSLTQAVNTLTQRTVFPSCSASVMLDGSLMRDGDCAGLCVLQSCWAWIGLTRENGRFFLTLRARQKEDGEEGCVLEKHPVSLPFVRLMAKLDFTDLRDEASFFFLKDGSWQPLGGIHSMHYELSHFTGNRFGLFGYTSVQPGGSAAFTDFIYKV